MGFLRNIGLAILAISGLIFVALFGRLPVFRKTPIGFAHRTIWIYIPNGIASLDRHLFGGRFFQIWNRLGSYILHDNHPLILIFFVSLLLGGEYLFIPTAWSRISTVHRFLIPVAVLPPYLLLYACVVTKSFITPENHARELHRYPYDRLLFHAGHDCSTCRFPKPARSKHCSICKACVSRHDHHCVWLMNCVGLHNYQYFLSLLVSVSALLIYGSYLGHELLIQTLDELDPSRLRSITQWSSIDNWMTFFNIWALAIAADIRIGFVYLLAVMCIPLALAFLAYHTYLVWAGMTTNESAKWDDLKDDIADGCVFRSTKKEIYGDSPVPAGLRDDHPTWPMTSDQIILVTDGQPPADGFMLSSRSNYIVQQEGQRGPIDPRWRCVRSLREVDNIYDLGFWDNLREALRLRFNSRKSAV